MSKKQILDVGQCPPDHATIKSFLQQHFTCEVDQAHGPEDTEEMLRKKEFDLVLINRKLDRDYTDGLVIIQKLKQDPELQSVPVMLVTNYPEHQDQAEAAGAIRGFGKLEFGEPQTLARLKMALE